MSIAQIKPKEVIQIPEPPIARFLFADTRMAWLWLIVRLYVGYEWLTAGLDKLTGYSLTPPLVRNSAAPGSLAPTMVPL